MTAPIVRIEPRSIIRTLAACIVALDLLHLAGQLLRHFYDMDTVYGLVEQFDLANEGNLPAFFAALELLACGVLLGLIGLAKLSRRERWTLHWLALAAVLIYLSADEAAGLHELSIRPMREALPQVATGLFYWAWVIPGAVIALLLVLSFARFARQALPPAVRHLWVLGVAIFFVGAIGVEMPEAWYVQLHGQRNFGYALFVLVEETLEMVGVLVLLAGILRYWRTELGPVMLDPGRVADAAARATVSDRAPSAATARYRETRTAARSR